MPIDKNNEDEMEKFKASKSQLKKVRNYLESEEFDISFQGSK